MKKILLSLLIAAPGALNAQNVGIGTLNPLARLHVTDSNAIFSAVYTDGSFPFNLPITGAGTRMMWLPAVGAFRAGTVSGNYWNQDSIGIYSFASGLDTRALGQGSTAMGKGSLALDSWSVAIGLNDTAAAFETVAMGTNNKASGFGATALGARSVASGNYSVVAGQQNFAKGNNSFSAGSFSNANADNAIAIGNGTTAQGIGSTALGNGTIASGNTSTTMGYGTTASGDYSIAAGVGSTASGIFSSALGHTTNASGAYSTAIGAGTTASGNTSTALGSSTTASGLVALSTGTGTTARSYASFVAGAYNDSIASSSRINWVSTDPLIIFGNGTADNSRHNATVIYKNGDADLNGYTRLGEITDGAPRIKVKKITGTGPAVNGNIAIVHGLPASKILSVAVSMEYGLGPAETVPAFYTISSGFEYQYQVRASDILISNKNGNSANIASMPVKILITYEE
jgi:hypothetical protein